MSNDLSVQPVTPLRSANDAVGEVSTAAVQTSAQPVAAAKSPPIYNPTLRFDSSLGLVVIEFRSGTGLVTTQVPSQQQLNAYQRWSTTRLGPPPPGMAVPAPAATPTPHAPTKGSHTK